MGEKTINYIKLPGSGYRSAGSPFVRFALFFVIGFFVLLLRGKRVQLYLGNDHLLVLDTDGYVEEYKRFYWRDIQGFTLRRTVEGKIINLVFGAPFILFSALALSSRDNAAVFLFGIIATVCLIFLIINIVQGPTCDVELFTAVQAEKMPSLGRVKVAKKVLARLQPIINEAQGELKPEEMVPDNPAESVPFEVSQAKFSSSTPVVETYQSKVHSILSWVALADVPGTCLTVFLGQELLRAYSLLHIVALIILSIIALNKQRYTTLPVGLKRLPVVILSGVVICFITSFVLGIYFAFADQEAVATMRENTLGAPWQVVLTVISTAINGFAGLYGVVQLKKYKQSLVEVVPPPLVAADSPVNPDQSI